MQQQQKAYPSALVSLQQALVTSCCLVKSNPDLTEFWSTRVYKYEHVPPALSPHLTLVGTGVLQTQLPCL